MKLTAEQLDKAAQAIKEAHQEYHPTMDDYREMALAAFAAVESEPVNAPEDLLRSMLDAWYGDTDGMPPYDDLQCESMARTLRVALADPRVLGDPGAQEIDSAWYKQGTLNHHEISNVVAHFIAARRNHLARESAENRVTISEQEDNRCFVCIDGNAVLEIFTGAEKTAPAVRAGLIQMLKESGK